MPVSRDELLGCARLLHPILAAVKRELRAVVPHRDPDLHAQARRLGEAPLEAREPRTVLHRVVRQRRRAYYLYGNNQSIKRINWSEVKRYSLADDSS